MKQFVCRKEPAPRKSLGGKLGRILFIAVSVNSIVVSSSIASGTWTFTSLQDWQGGSGFNIDELTIPGSIAVRRNQDDEFIYSAPNTGPLPTFWAQDFSNGGYERTATPGSLRLTSPNGYSDMWGAVDSCPKIFQPIDGDFAVESNITSGSGPHDYWAAQLFVRKDSINWFGCGITLDISGYHFETRMVNAGLGTGVKAVAGSSNGEFKIARNGTQITGYYRTGGTAWIDLGSASPSWLNGQLEVGIYMKDTVIVNSYAVFDYVHFSTTRTAAATAIYLSRTIDLGVAPAAAGSVAWAQSVPLGASIALQTRTSADGTSWSNWSAPYATPAGSTITSPLARYIQFSSSLTENGSLQTPQIDSVSITFPGIAPKSPVVSSPAYVDNIWGNSKATDVSWTEPVDTPAPVWAYYYSIDSAIVSGTALTSSSVLVSKTVTGMSIPGLVDGIHTFNLVSQGDPAEYPNSAPATFTFKKDTVPPDAVAITSATHPTAAPNANDSPVFDLVAADSNSATDLNSGVSGYLYVLDTLPASIPTGTSAFSASSPVSFTGLQDGYWVFHCRAKDAAGNLGVVGHYQFTVSYKGRVGVQISSPTHPENQESASNHPEFLLATSNPDSATLVGYHYVLDANPVTQPTIADGFTTASSLSFAGLRNQMWYLHVCVKNSLGSLSNPAHYGFRVNYQGHLIEEGKIHAVPHPIRSSPATIRYELMAPAQAVDVELLSETGRRLRTFTGTIAPGFNSLSIDVSGLANGIYLCRFKVRKQDGKDEIVLKKLAIVR